MFVIKSLILEQQFAIMKNFLLFILLIIPPVAFSQKLSPEAQISVITCGPYQEELYSAFGHSAFRVYDPATGIDDAYNYGVFDFDQPNFYLNFARGYLYYKLGVYPYDRFRDFYIYYNRYVHEQVLDLTPAQKQRLYDYLLWNAQPENETYRYDYFKNNCATKIRDIMITVFGDSVKFDGSYITTTYSLRDLININLKHQPWGDLALDLGLGLPSDKIATPFEYMFLPDYVESGFDHSTLNGNPVVKSKISVYKSRDEEYSKTLISPTVALILTLIVSIALSFWDVKRKQLSLWFDAMLFGIVGLVGSLLFFMWVATDHHTSARNFNLLWALPTHLLVVFAFIKNPAWVKNYFLGTAIILTLVLVFWVILPQQLNYVVMPIIVALLIRSWIQFKLRSQLT
jgi:hypothetical protein